MKRSFIKFMIYSGSIVLVFLIFGNASGQTNKTETKVSDMRSTVQNFYRLREKTLDARGKEKDVLQLLELLADDIVYEHPVANAKLTKEQVRRGMMSHLNEGKNAFITLHDIKEGKNFLIVELSLRYEVEGKQINRRGVSIFEFAQGKIQRIAEY